MPMFEYVSKNKSGEVMSGKMEAADSDSIADYLRSRNYFPISIKREGISNDVDLSAFMKIPIKDIAIFCRQLGFIITAGITILRALEIVKAQLENKKLRKILNIVFDDVQKGIGLSEAMSFHKDIPKMLISMVAVGEASGTLDTIMIRMADYYEKSYKQKQKIKGALTYPIIVSIFAIFVVILLVVKVLPTFTGMIADTGGGKLPLPTRLVLGLSNLLTTQYLLITGILIALTLSVITFYRTEEGRMHVDKLLLTLPVLGKLNKRIITAQFSRTFGTLMSSAVPLIKSIEICSDTMSNTIIKNTLISSRDDIKKGTSLGETLESKKQFPLMLTQMIKIGEESGTLDSILAKTAEFYDNEVEAATAQLTTMVEPLIIITLAFVVGFIVLAIIMPMFQMYNNLNNAALFILNFIHI